MSSNSHEVIITAENMMYLKDLLLMIKNQKPSDYSYDSKFDKVNEILEKFHNYQRRISDYHQIPEQHLPTNSFSNYVPAFNQLARECLLSHDFSNALKIVNTLVTEKDDKVANTLWKAGMASLIIGNKPKLVDLYVRQLYKVRKLSCVEVILDYLMYLLTEGNLARAKDLLEDLKMCHTNTANEAKSTHRNYGKLLFCAYQGLRDYLQWKCEINSHNDDMADGETDFINSKLAQDTTVQPCKGTAEKAIENLSCVKSIPGVWDIFIVKMVEMHMFYGEVDSARLLLRDYRTANPNNPNAHRYVYHVEKEIEEEHGVDKLQSLKSLVKLDPSNPLAIDLYKELESKWDPEAISILFDYLDFDHCKDDIHAWELLEKHLSKIKRRCGNSNKDRQVKTVKKCWASRKDWWPSSTLHAEDDSLSQLSKLKIVVQNYLNNK